MACSVLLILSKRGLHKLNFSDTTPLRKWTKRGFSFTSRWSICTKLGLIMCLWYILWTSQGQGHRSRVTNMSTLSSWDQVFHSILLRAKQEWTKMPLRSSWSTCYIYRRSISRFCAKKSRPPCRSPKKSSPPCRRTKTKSKPPPHLHDFTIEK